VEDLDQDPAKACEAIAREWSISFGAKYTSIKIREVSRAFEGTAAVRVRATVAHDSYERLIDIPCSHEDHRIATGLSGLDALPKTIEKPESLGLSIERLGAAASLDESISEFSRFYLERREQETRAASDERKRKKLQDEFTPRLDMMLVGLEGKLHREVKLHAEYTFDSKDEYDCVLTVIPKNGKIVDLPEMSLCSKSGRIVPRAWLSKCEITGAEALRHLLVKSEVSGRFALPEFTVQCALSGKRLFRDESDVSAVTGNVISSDLLKTSALSGKRAEPEHFGNCCFTNSELLKDELAVSEISGGVYRIDHQVRSIVSGKTGHKQEFATCHETRQPIALEEAERCDITGYPVRIGVLQICESSGKRVLPIGLDRCSLTGKRVLKRFLVTSSVSDTKILEEVAIRSVGGLFCTPAEAKACVWSGRKYHPDDIRKCQLTGLPIHFEFATSSPPYRLLPLVEMLDGIKRNSDKADRWPEVANRIAAATKGGKYNVEAAVLSPDTQHLATCSELRTMLGMRVFQVGALYDLASNSVVGRICAGKRGRESWSETTR
jgi:hypothetical protein